MTHELDLPNHCEPRLNIEMSAGGIVPLNLAPFQESPTELIFSAEAVRRALNKHAAVSDGASPDDLLRISKGTDTPVSTRFSFFNDHVTIDTADHSIFYDDEPVDITNMQFKLITYLGRQAGSVFRRPEILKQVWGTDHIGSSRTIDVHVRRLRAQLDDEAIETVRNVGYRAAK